jgi:hypothetical protein
MTDFKVKHEELYLEEITNILNTAPRGGVGEVSEGVKISILNIISKLNLSNTELLLNVLQILKTYTNNEDFENICTINFEGYGLENLNKIVMRVFKPNICDLILEKYGVKNEQ